MEEIEKEFNFDDLDHFTKEEEPYAKQIQSALLKINTLSRQAAIDEILAQEG